MRPVEQVSDPAQGRRLKLLLVAVVSATLLLGGIFGRHGWLELRHYRAERDRLREEIRELEVQVKSLEAEVRRLQEDPAAVERIAREELTLARPGEYVVLLPPAGASAGAPAATVLDGGGTGP